MLNLWGCSSLLCWDLTGLGIPGQAGAESPEGAGLGDAWAGPPPAPRSCRRPRTRSPASAGLPSSAWAAASARPPSRRSPGSCPCRSGWPAAWPRPSAGPAGRSGVSSKGEGREEAHQWGGHTTHSQGRLQLLPFCLLSWKQLQLTLH